MTDWTRVMRAIAPHAKQSVLDNIAFHMDEYFEKYKINTPLRQAHFLAQAAHESAGFTTLTELGGDDYFKRYDAGTKVGKRLGNTKKGDGLRFKGRCPFQLTGRANYTEYGKLLGIDLVNHPELATDPRYTLAICCLYWNKKGLSAFADNDDVGSITYRINGGYNGYAERKMYLVRAKKALGIAVLPVVNFVDAEPMARDKVKALQERLRLRGYYMVGKPDGQIGGNTTAAISAYQLEHDLPVTGTINPATEKSLWASDEKRPINFDRAEGEPEGSDIVKNAKSLMKGAAGLGGAGAVSLANNTLDKVESVSGYYERVTSILAPFAMIKNIVFSPIGLSVALILGAGALAYYAYKIHRSRIEDHQTGRTA